MEHQAFAQLLGNYGEFVGAIAVVITLAYLAVQIRQNTESVRLSSELALSQQTSDFAARMWAHPEMLRIWDLAVTDPPLCRAMRFANTDGCVQTSFWCMKANISSTSAGMLPRMYGKAKQT